MTNYYVNLQPLLVMVAQYRYLLVQQNSPISTSAISTLLLVPAKFLSFTCIRVRPYRLRLYRQFAYIDTLFYPPEHVVRSQ